MQVKRATRESHMGFSLTQLTCDIHHFHSVYIKQNESYACLTLVVGEEGQEKSWEVEISMFSEKEKNWVLWMPWRLHTAAYPRWTNQCLWRKLIFPAASLSWSDNALRSGGKIPLSPFYQWGSVPRRLSNIHNATELVWQNASDGTRFWVSASCWFQERQIVYPSISNNWSFITLTCNFLEPRVSYLH